MLFDQRVDIELILRTVDENFRYQHQHQHQHHWSTILPSLPERRQLRGLE